MLKILAGQLCVRSPLPYSIMGKRGGKRVSTSKSLSPIVHTLTYCFQGRGVGRGGGRGGGQRSIRVDYSEVPKANELYEKYYNELGLVDDTEKEEFWSALKRDLPSSFRFTGSKGYFH